MTFQPRTLVSILLLLMAIGLAQMALMYPRMPATMASHFSADGHAEKWTTRQAFFGGMAVLHVGVSLLLLGTAYAMKLIPMRMINIPKKDYWADPEHEDEARNFLYSYMLWFACATVALLNMIVYATCRANLHPAQGMGYWPLVVTVAYGVWVAAWVGRMIWRFYRIPKEEADEGLLRGRGGEEGRGRTSL
jgi:uncharacterized membrane protein